MRKFVMLLLFFFAILGMLVNSAEAARFGGGRSFGAQRSLGGFSYQRQANSAYQSNTPRRSWAAPLAGLALGSMLGYLLMGHGLGSGLLSWLLIAAIGFLIWNFFRTKLQVVTQGGRSRNGRVFEAQSYFKQTNDYASESSTTLYPMDFNRESFLREAKVQFIRLQAAYDSKNMQDLREFTAPEVFAEIQMQLQERGDEPNHTEVISLNADLLDVKSENQTTMATVKFSGVIRETADKPSSFEEAWHFSKNDRNKWIVAGVQQTLH